MVAGGVYLFWWFAVELALPSAFNPFPSRGLVVGTIFLFFGLSYFSKKVRQKIRLVFVAGIWLITFHFFYLFYRNSGDTNWVIGSYITVIAISIALISAAELLAYSLFVLLMAGLLVVVLPALEVSVFFPGLVTILVQANITLKFRLDTIRHLKASNKRFQLLFNSTFEGVLLHEMGTIKNTNDALNELFGYGPGEVIGKSVLDLIHPDVREQVASGMKLVKHHNYETKGITRSGRAIDIEFRAKNFQDEGRPARLVTIRDISDRKRAEDERVKMLTMRENVRIRDEFISIASHELRTPISTLKLQTQIIERDLKKSPDQMMFSTESVQNLINLFNRQINRLTELVETMLDVSRISAGRLTLEIHEMDLVRLVRESIEARGSERISFVGPEKLIIHGDKHRLEQVVENLLTNAIKYGDGKPISVKVSADTTCAILDVEDHGIGIAEEYLQRIFERFERAISARNISGLGLGLYIVRQIVDAHNGTISVKSKLGAGTTFTVKLPLRSGT